MLLHYITLGMTALVRVIRCSRARRAEHGGVRGVVHARVPYSLGLPLTSSFIAGRRIVLILPLSVLISYILLRNTGFCNASRPLLLMASPEAIASLHSFLVP